MELLGDDCPIKIELKKNKVKKQICDEITKINFRSKKLDLALLNSVMNLIEIKIDNQKYNKEINKKYLLLEIYAEIYGAISEDEKALIGKNIEYIIKSNTLIKVTRFKRIVNFLRGFFRK